MREREPLEAFDISELKVVSVAPLHECAPYALIRDPNGYVHRVFVGDYMGKSFGLVVEFVEDGVRVREMYEDERGWHEREVWLWKPKK